MSVYLQKFRGVIGISLIWAPVWAAMFTILMYVLQVFLPPDNDVGTIKMMAIIGWVGLVSGVIFGIFLSINESGKAVHNLSLGRAMMWGVLSSAIYPVVTQRANQVFWTCTFGAVVAIALVGLARKADNRDLTRPRGFFDILLACARRPVRDAVSPLKESVT
ncbi:MAG: hypothetical protein IPG76_04250 [Acidobacteria bacterium]|nr:hypothetical protein [Acidobacteriota bacterium]